MPYALPLCVLPSRLLSLLGPPKRQPPWPLPSPGALRAQDHSEDIDSLLVRRQCLSGLWLHDAAASASAISTRSTVRAPEGCESAMLTPDTLQSSRSPPFGAIRGSALSQLTRSLVAESPPGIRGTYVRLGYPLLPREPASRLAEARTEGEAPLADKSQSVFEQEEVCGTDFGQIHLNCTRGGWLRPTNQLQIVR